MTNKQCTQCEGTGEIYGGYGKDNFKNITVYSNEPCPSCTGESMEERFETEFIENDED